MASSNLTKRKNQTKQSYKQRLETAAAAHHSDDEIMQMIAADGSSKYSIKDKILAVITYSIEGNYIKSAELSGIPAHMLREWAKRDWWDAWIWRNLSENLNEIDSQFTKIIKKSMDSVLTRLEKGDYSGRHRKTGRIQLKPVSAKDSAVIMAITFDKRQIARNLPTNITQSSDVLSKIADSLNSLGIASAPQPAEKISKTIEGERLDGKS